MTSDADAVVIGSGALGASTAYYLAERKRRVVLLDKFDLPHRARRARLVWHSRCKWTTCWPPRDPRIQTLTHFEQETGVPLDVVVNGSVKIARTEDDAGQLEEEVRRGKISASRSTSPRRPSEKSSPVGKPRQGTGALALHD
jgi:glycine/D-amino acid oxidase-like deaminating enzyme